MKISEHIIEAIFRDVDIRRKSGLSVKREDCMESLAQTVDTIICHWENPPAQCPVCSSDKCDSRPQFLLAQRTTKAKGEAHWCLDGCKHATAISFERILSKEGVDSYLVDWQKEVKELFERTTAHYTDAQKEHRKKVLGLT